VLDEAALCGYTVLLAPAERIAPGEASLAGLIDEGRVDGFLVQGRDDVEESALGDVLGRNSPVVMVNSTSHDHRGSVTVDDALGARLGTQHLIELGHERIGLINGTPEMFTAKRRRQGYTEALRSAGLPVARTLITSTGYHPDVARTALRDLMTQKNPPTAVFVANVNAALGVLAEARALGLNVPHDLSVVAFHDGWTADHSWPPLTTVRMPLYEMGRAAITEMRHVLDGQRPQDVVIDQPLPQVIVRESAVPRR